MRGLRWFAAFAIERSLLLIAGAVLALVWANTAAESYARVSHALHFVVNDIGMVFFFAMAAKEIVEATRLGGPLASPKESALPLFAAAGGMIVPSALYAAAALAAGLPDLLRGWAIPCATDIAFSYLIARVVFPAHHPAIPFLLLLAVADDALGLVVLALFYPAAPVSLPWFVLCMTAAIGVAWLLRRRRVANYWPYVLGAGGLAWSGLFLGGLHPALALVPIVPFMTVERQYHELFEDTEPAPVETLNVFADQWRVPVQGLLFLFGLVNAGVALSSVGPATWIVLGSLIVGKPVGIVLATMMCVAAGLQRPRGMHYTDVVVVGVMAGIGFTVALFFAVAAFPPGPVLDQAKMGALLSFLAGPLAIGVAIYRRRYRSRA